MTFNHNTDIDDPVELERERTEKVRQAIMRYRELLTIMRQRLDSSEAAYERLFSPLSEAERQLKEKDQQWRAAQHIVNDTTILQNAILSSHFAARQLQKDFEELYNIIAPESQE